MDQNLRLLAGEEPYAFTDEEHYPAGAKWQLLGDWQRFLHSGFKQVCFVRPLYDFLYRNCGFIAHFDQATFWATYFAAETWRLRRFLNQFAGNRQSAEYGTTAWLGGPTADLKAAMCREAGLVYPAISQVLQDLEYRHEELGRVWHEFALASGLPDPGFPTHYLISENTCNLLAYAAQIALKQPPPLAGLQTQFLVPLLYGSANPPADA